MTLQADLIAVKEAIATKRVRLGAMFEGVDELVGPARDDRARAIKSANIELSKLVDQHDTLQAEYEVQKLERDAAKSLRKAPRQIDPADDNPGWSNPDGVIALKSSQRFSDHVRLNPAEDVGLGKWLAALVTGNWDGIAAPVKAMAVGTPGAGGYLVPEPLSVRLIDLARSTTRVVQAGALTIPMASSTMKIARLASDPDAEWKAENAAIASESELSFESVELRARTLIAIATMSVELAEDGADVNNVVERALGASLGLELDRAALYGSASGEEPRGVINTAGVGVTDTSAGLPGGYSDFSYAVERIRGANHEPNAIIYSPFVAGTLDRLTDTTGQPLRPLPSFEALSKFTTNQVQTGDAFVGDWNELLIGMRTNLTIEASREAATESGNAFSKLQIKVRAYLRADIAVARPAAFEVLTDIEQGGS